MQIFETDAFVCTAAGEFLAEGLRAGEPAIALATPAHRRELEEVLRRTGVDVAREQAAGRLVLLDAQSVLDELMVGPLPDRTRLRTAIGGRIDGLTAATGAARVRAYGEMLDLLWRAGRRDAARQLDELLYELACERGFSLLSGVALASIVRVREPGLEGLRDVCELRGQLCPLEPACAGHARLADDTEAPGLGVRAPDAPDTPDTPDAPPDAPDAPAGDPDPDAPAGDPDPDVRRPDASDAAVRPADASSRPAGHGPADRDPGGLPADPHPADPHPADPHPADPRAMDARAVDARAVIDELARRAETERALRAALAEAQRSAERASAERDELRAALDDAPVPVHVLDARGVITWANREELALLGYERDEYIGRSFADLHLDPATTAEIDRRLRAGQAVRDVEVRVRARDGDVRHLLVSASVVRRGDELGAIRCFSRDVTERLRGEHDRERQLAELTRAVRLADAFAGVLGHDLRNPLNTITLTGQLLATRAQGQDPVGARAIQRMLDSAARMQRMIEQLVEFSRARASGTVALDPQPADLAELAAAAIAQLRAAHPTAEVALDTRGHARGTWDAQLLAQVLATVLDNAVQHGPPGAPVAVRVVGAPDGGAPRGSDPDGSDPAGGGGAGGVRITVENRGELAEALRPILFAPFRGKDQRSPRSRGLGLGLFLAEQIVRAHGGRIAAIARDGTTRLEIDLPAAPPAEPRAAAPPASRRPRATPPAVPATALAAPISEATLQLGVRNIRDYAIFMLDLHGHVVTWNTGAQRIKGYSTEEVVGQHFSLFYPLDDVRRGKCERELEIAAREGQYEERGWRLRKGGAPFWAHVLITAVRDAEGQLFGFAKVTRDLTEEVRAQAAARQGEERFRLLVEGVEEYAIFMLDLDGNVTTWNPGAERITGYRAAEIVGRHVSHLFPEPAQRAGEPERELAEARARGRFTDEGWRARKDGTAFWAQVLLTALRDERGAPIGFVQVTRDLTERRRREEEALRLAHAQEAVRLRDEFLSIASHELRTPITVLQLQLDALRAWLGDVAPALLPKLDRTSRATQRLGELAATLLDVSRLATGQFDLARERVDLAALVREVVDRMSEASALAGCDVRCTLEDGLVGSWDRGRIDQVVSSLLANALKYAAGRPIEVVVQSAGEAAVELVVRDHGPGLPAGREAQLFERFERAASMRHYGGLGLGLYLVHQIVDAHGGTARAWNAPDGGACFGVRLPREPAC